MESSSRVESNYLPNTKHFSLPSNKQSGLHKKLTWYTLSVPADTKKRYKELEFVKAKLSFDQVIFIQVPFQPHRSVTLGALSRQ